MRETIIRAENVTKNYGGLTAVDGVDISIHGGDFFGFLGPNGAGKTTTIKMLTGLTNISSGQVTVFGKQLNKNLNYIKKRIGITGESTNLFPDLTVKDNLKFKAKMFGVRGKEAEKRIKNYLSEFNLNSKTNTKYLFLSKGQKRIISILSSLIHKPDIIFLDEPTIGLDIKARGIVYGFLRRLNGKGVTVFLTSHYFEEIELLCSNLAVINKGRIIYSGKMEEIKKLFPSDKILAVRFDGKPVEFEAQRYFENFRISGNFLYLRNAEVSGALEKISKFSKETKLKVIEVNTEGNKLEDLFVKLIKKDDREK
ncbi:MAG: ABC transporter ATP-binding protein [Elusimicrobia bacterium]|nr:ABC transporter ATP-binding protein [Elusimicrobiota bacterium]